MTSVPQHQTADHHLTAFSLAGADGFTTLHGTPVVAIDDDCGTLLMLGHPDDRHVLATTSAQYRVLYGQRIRGGRALGDLLPHGVRRTWARAVPGGDDCPWHTEVTAPDAQHALPITLVEVDVLDAEDIAVQEQCPACDRASRTSDIACPPAAPATPGSTTAAPAAPGGRARTSTASASTRSARATGSTRTAAAAAAAPTPGRATPAATRTPRDPDRAARGRSPASTTWCSLTSRPLALPIPVNGALGPWRPSQDLVHQVLLQLPHLRPEATS